MSNNNITRKEIAEQLDINESAIQKHIQNLKNKKVIERVGGRKDGYWRVF
jgi:ATP-dependent DNA helicase RecG